VHLETGTVDVITTFLPNRSKSVHPVLLAVFAAACGDQGPVVTGDVNVTLQKTDAVLTQLVGDWAASIVSGDASMASVDPDTVETLVIR